MQSEGLRLGGNPLKLVLQLALGFPEAGFVKLGLKFNLVELTKGGVHLFDRGLQGGPIIAVLDGNRALSVKGR